MSVPGASRGYWMWAGVLADGLLLVLLIGGLVFHRREPERPTQAPTHRSNGDLWDATVTVSESSV
jgi:hypothetical protein